MPFDTPSSARFLGTRLMVANQSFTGDRDHQAVLDVETREAGLPELIPGLDRDPPTLSRVVAVAQAGARRPARARARALPRERALDGELPGRAARGRPLAQREELHAQERGRAAARRPSGPAACGPAATAWWCAPRTPRATARSASIRRFRVVP